MYLIIGGDGKEYGPISGADLRRWVAEGRLSAQSMVKAESDAEFRTLSTFPEFADVFAVPAPAPGVAPMLATGGGGREAALDKVKVPAIGLVITGIINVLLSLYGLAVLPFGAGKIQQMDQQLSQLNMPQFQQLMDQIMHFAYGPFGIVNDIFQLIISILILVGALKLLKLQSYQFAYAAAILSLIPCIAPCCLLGLIFGIWSIMVMGKPDVKSQFS